MACINVVFSVVAGRCGAFSAENGDGGEELKALALGPLRRACSFRSMTTFGSHYRVQLEEDGVAHVTFDFGWDCSPLTDVTSGHQTAALMANW